MDNMDEFDPMADLLNQFARTQTTEKEDLVKQFQMICPDVDAEVAKFFLEANNYNVAVSIGSYFENIGNGGAAQHFAMLAMEQSAADQAKQQANAGEGDDDGWDLSLLSLSGPRLEAALVSDITVPPASPCAPGQKLKKMWRVLNAGKIPWPQDTCLHFAQGEIMTEGNVQRVAVGTIDPGSFSDVSIDLELPTGQNSVGPHGAQWQLCFNNQGNLQPFGPMLEVVVQITENMEQVRQYWAQMEAEREARMAHIDTMTMELIQQRHVQEEDPIIGLTGMHAMSLGGAGFQPQQGGGGVDDGGEGAEDAVGWE